MDPDEVIRALVSVGLVVTMSLGANCQGAAGKEVPPARTGLSSLAEPEHVAVTTR